MSRYRNKNYLTQKELEDIVAHLSESEDDFDDSDEDIEEEDNIDLSENVVVGEEPFDLESMEIEFEDGTILEPPAVADTTQNLPKQHAKKLKEKYSKIVWRKKNLVLPEDRLKFLGDDTIPDHISNIESPISFFLYFFDNDLIKKNCFRVQFTFYTN